MLVLVAVLVLTVIVELAVELELGFETRSISIAYNDDAPEELTGIIRIRAHRAVELRLIYTWKTLDAVDEGSLCH